MGKYCLAWKPVRTGDKKQYPAVQNLPQIPCNPYRNEDLDIK